MKYEITIDQDQRLIHTKVWGELTVETVTKLTTDVGGVAARHGFVHFLFDMRETTEEAGTIDAFFLAVNPERRGLDRTHRRAIVHRGDNPLYDFFETVSDNRGYSVKTFTDIDRALEWLQES
jgi:hypothetical protein